MAKFAVIDGESVLNTIIADSKEIAEQLTGKTCVEFTNEPAEAGGSYVNGKFIQVKPYPSWIKVDDSYWKAPVDIPEYDSENPKSYVWNEETISWEEVTND